MAFVSAGKGCTLVCNICKIVCCPPVGPTLAGLAAQVSSARQLLVTLLDNVQVFQALLVQLLQRVLHQALLLHSSARACGRGRHAQLRRRWRTC